MLYTGAYINQAGQARIEDSFGAMPRSAIYKFLEGVCSTPVISVAMVALLIMSK